MAIVAVLGNPLTPGRRASAQAAGCDTATYSDGPSLPISKTVGSVTIEVTNGGDHEHWAVTATSGHSLDVTVHLGGGTSGPRTSTDASGDTTSVGEFIQNISATSCPIGPATTTTTPTTTSVPAQAGCAHIAWHDGQPSIDQPEYSLTVGAGSTPTWNVVPKPGYTVGIVVTIQATPGPIYSRTTLSGSGDGPGYIVTIEGSACPVQMSTTPTTASLGSTATTVTTLGGIRTQTVAAAQLPKTGMSMTTLLAAIALAAIVYGSIFHIWASRESTG